MVMSSQKPAFAELSFVVGHSGSLPLGPVSYTHLDVYKRQCDRMEITREELRGNMKTIRWWTTMKFGPSAYGKGGGKSKTLKKGDPEWPTTNESSAKAGFWEDITMETRVKNEWGSSQKTSSRIEEGSSQKRRRKTNKDVDGGKSTVHEMWRWSWNSKHKNRYWRRTSPVVQS